MKKKIEMFDVCVYSVVTLICIIMLYPFLNVIAVAFSEYTEYLKNPLMILPSGFTLSAFKFVLKEGQVIVSYGNTIFVTVMGVLIGLTLITLMAYPLSRLHLKGRGIIMNIVIFSMMFSGGMIPNYYLVRSLGLIDSLWAVILPGAFSAYNMILMKNFLEALPDSLMEAASIDGASEPCILFKIGIASLQAHSCDTVPFYCGAVLEQLFHGNALYQRSYQMDASACTSGDCSCQCTKRQQRPCAGKLYCIHKH